MSSARSEAAGSPIHVVGRRRALFAATLLWAMSIAMGAQYALGVLAPLIRTSLEVSRASIGFLITVFFGVGAACSLVAGPLADRVGGRRMLMGMFVLSGSGLVGMGLSPTYAFMLLAVGVGGLGAAIAMPVTNQLVAVHLPRGQQGWVMGVKQSGVQFAAFLSGAILPSAALAFGWRSVLVASGATALIGFLAAHIVLPTSRSGGGADTTAERTRELGRYRGFVLTIAAYAFLMGSGVAAGGTFVVLYAVEALALSAPTAGAVAALIGFVAVVARILWGRLTELLTDATVALAALALLAAGAQVLVWSAVIDPRLIWPGAVIYGVSAAAWSVVAHLTVVREVDPAATGRATGIVQGSFFVGFIVAPPLFGHSVDTTGAYNVGWGAITVAFGIAAVLMLWRRYRV